MTPDQLELPASAKDSPSAARLLLEGGYPRSAASRAYYAMFHVAEALLEGEGVSFPKHSAVIAASGRQFARTGRVPAQFQKFLLEGQQQRHDADYGRRGAVTRGMAEEQIDRAERFQELSERLVGPVPPGDSDAPQ